MMAGACAAPACAASADDAPRPRALLAELPPVDVARAMRVHRGARVLDASEVSAIVASAERERARLGIVQRDAHRVPALDERATWSTYYLHTGGWLTREHPELVAKLWRAAVAADRAEGWRLLSRADERETAPPVTVRTAELHTVSRRGALADPRHFDGGSLVTVDVMLSERSDFAGGDLATLECDETLMPHGPWEQGDALIFPSHKYHCVTPVRQGLRQVLVIEVGEEKYAAGPSS